MTKKVLLIDDDELVRYALSRYLTKVGYDVIELPNGQKLKATITQQQPDIIVTDIIMPDVEGIEVVIETRKLAPSLPIIVISGGGRQVDTNYLDTALRLGAHASLEKPFDEKELALLIEKLTE